MRPCAAACRSPRPRCSARPACREAIMLDRLAFRTARLCARQELTIAVRSRWTQLFAGVFGVLALAIAASGYVLSGGSGVQDFARTAASLIQLVLLVVPLASIVMGVMALTPERGA